MVANFGKDLRERLAGVLARGDRRQFHVRMRQQQPHEFLAGITGRADNGDFDRTFIHCLVLSFASPAREADSTKRQKPRGLNQRGSRNSSPD